MIMNIDATKLELVQLLLKVEEESTLYKVKSILKKEISRDWWDDLSKEEKNDIEIGIAQNEKGETTPHSEVMKRFEKWH